MISMVTPVNGRALAWRRHDANGNYVREWRPWQPGDHFRSGVQVAGNLFAWSPERHATSEAAENAARIVADRFPLPPPPGKEF